MTRYYFGFRAEDGTCHVYAVAEGGSARPLRLRNGLSSYHSPSGFEWAYEGSGPAELARHLLMDACRWPALADRPDLYQRFKREVVAHLGATWLLDAGPIRAWVYAQGERPQEAAS